MKKTVAKRSALIGLAAIAIVSLGMALAALPARGNVTKSAEGSIGGAYSENAHAVVPTAFRDNWGDVDQNARRDSTDARLVLQYAVQKIPQSALLTDAADVDGDGAVNSTDARLILQYAVKKISVFPVTETVYAYAVQKGLTDAASEATWLAALLGDAYTKDAAIVGAYVNTENHLILKLSNDTTADAGLVAGTVTSTEPTSTTPTTEAPAPPPTTVPTAPTATATHLVTFTDFDGTVLKTERMETGKSAVPPTPPYRNGYLFTGWDITFANVTTDLTVTAQYCEITEPALAATNVWGKAGETMQLPVTVHNNPGIAGARIFVHYSGGVVLESAAAGDALGNLDYTAPATLESPCPFNWDSLDAVSTVNGTVLTLTFTIPADATAGETFDVELAYHTGDIYDGALDDVELRLVNGTVTIL
ncbi:MAG: hypothetical protein E7549_03235 [Ruminococcaceae bacterium]|nr:hypothetical protein [Oscillospiraceae bacterium]